MNHKTLESISARIGRKQYKAAARLIDSALLHEPGPQWHKYLGKLAAFLRDPKGDTFANILVLGNGKLPFLAFSSLSGAAHCPGAGDCLDYCYTKSSWRYPAAFARQAQNTVLVHRQDPRILQDLEHKTRNAQKPVDFRLYVDGDFDSEQSVLFWFGILDSTIHSVNAYGYSKSFDELLSYSGRWPKNYTLNLSSGSNHSLTIEKQLAKKARVRGRFIAVNMGKKIKSGDHGNKQHQKALRQAHGSKAFTCPGQCGDCTPSGHACGSEKFNDVDIIIAAH